MCHNAVMPKEGEMIFVTGDTHGMYLLHIVEFCGKHPELTKDDYIIIAGDFGAVWSSSTLKGI